MGVVLFFAALLAWAGAAPISLDYEATAWNLGRNVSSVNENFNLVPVPQTMTWDRKEYVHIAGLNLDGLEGFSGLGTRQARAVDRFVRRFTSLTSNETRNSNYAPFPDQSAWLEDQQPASVRFTVTALLAPGVIDIPKLGDNESYALAITYTADTNTLLVSITASTSTGVLRAFATLLQLVTMKGPWQPVYTGAFYLPVGLQIVDSPFLAWRGGMIDVARHFHSVENLRRLLDGFEYFKLNVMHVHLSDDQGWRMLVPGWPNLGPVGGEGEFYTADELRALVEYAADRGIRVYPEFDVPGHAGALLYAYNNLCPHHYPTAPVHRWGIFNYVLDPTIDVVYTFLADLLREARAIFKDDYFHLGGDEVMWPPFSPAQLAWMQEHNVTSYSIHSYFNNRTIGLIQAAGFKAMGWQEIAQNPLPAGTVVHWWSYFDPSSQYKGVNSAGLYLDHVGPVSDFWQASLAGGNLVGAEFCMWSEWAADNIDTRIYPSMLAAAENLWIGSPRSRGLSMDVMLHRVMVQDVSSEAIGLPHRSIYRTQIAALATAAGLASGSGTWTYAEAVANMSVAPPPNNAVYDALFHLADLFRPDDRVNVGGPAYPNFEFVDASKPNSMHMEALRRLCRRALAEQLDGPATDRLLELLTAYTRIEFVLSEARATSGFIVLAQNVGAIATAWKTWIMQARSGAPAEIQRQNALNAGTAYASLAPHNWVLHNTLKELSPAFLVPVTPGPRPSTTTARPTTRTTTRTTAATTTTTTTPTITSTTTSTTTTPLPTTAPRPTTAAPPTAPPGSCVYPPIPATARGTIFSVVFNLDFAHFDCPSMVASFAQLWLRPQHIIRLVATSALRRSARGSLVLATFNVDDSADAAGTASVRFAQLAAALNDPTSADAHRASSLGIPVLRTDPLVTTTQPTTSPAVTTTLPTSSAATTTAAGANAVSLYTMRNAVILAVGLVVLATVIVGAIVVLRRWRAQRQRSMAAPPAGVSSEDHEAMVEVDVDASNEDLFDDL